MSVTERLMGVGSWSLNLSPDTPGDVRSKTSLKRYGFGHIVITPTRLDPNAVSDATMLERARYVGVYRKQPSEFEMGGVGVNAWVGDEDGKGRSFSSLAAGGSSSFSDWRTAILASVHGITGGVTSVIAGTHVKTFPRGVVRPVIDDVCKRFGAEWRVTTDFKLDFGLPADLFRTDPVAVIIRSGGGRDLNVLGVMGDIDLERDLEDWAYRVLFFNTASGGAEAFYSGGISTDDTPYRAPDGTYAFIDRIVEDVGGAIGAAASAIVIAEWGLSTGTRQEIRLSSVEYDIGGTVSVGDNLWVFDPDRDMFDLANPVVYRGATIYPEVIRCVGQTWPVRNGMGVYFRRFVDNSTATWDVDWVDLSPYVVWESGDTTVEVGAKPRPVF